MMRLIEVDEGSNEFINADKVSYIYMDPSSGIWYVKVDGLNDNISISTKCLRQLLLYGKAL